MGSYPSHGIRRKFKTAVSSADTALSSTITVPAGAFGIVWKLGLSLNTSTEAMLEALPGLLLVKITIGDLVWTKRLHPFIEHRNGSEAYVRTVDLGPWDWDFGIDGLYSAVPGDDIVVQADAAGGTNTTIVSYIYSGD